MIIPDAGLAQEAPLNPITPQPRAAEIVDLIDPRGVLPELSLIRDYSSQDAKLLGRLGISRYVAYDVTTPVGEIHAFPVEDMDAVQVSFIKAEVPKAGYEMAMVLELAVGTVEQGRALMNDTSGEDAQTKRLWKKLATPKSVNGRAAATAVESFGRNADEQGHWHGIYMILPGAKLTST